MNNYLIETYINKLKKEDILNYARKQEIYLDKEEIDIIYNYIKYNYKKIIYNNPQDTLKEIKKEVKPITYNKIENLYIKFKDKIDIFIQNIREG